ncbi:MAG: hypothetical protein EAX81_04445 [Candidatus Thorarchaeota archaeon]|nr:hypothetical protein [Candidatus Thorarchaeota archaeon]
MPASALKTSLAPSVGVRVLKEQYRTSPATLSKHRPSSLCRRWITEAPDSETADSAASVYYV